MTISVELLLVQLLPLQLLPVQVLLPQLLLVRAATASPESQLLGLVSTGDYQQSGATVQLVAVMVAVADRPQLRR